MTAHSIEAIQQLDAIPGDVAAALAAAEPAVTTVRDEMDGVVVVAHRNDHHVTTLNLEHYLLEPVRQRGTVEAYSAEAFIALVERRTPEGAPATVYVDPDQLHVVAVLNDDCDDMAGWRDHRVTYSPVLTPEWKLWAGGQGLGPQAQFAGVIEQGEPEIREPSATVMLELAQTFQASTAAKFKQAGRLRDGRTQLVYEEEIEATAGSEGLITIPESFVIEVRPFYGAQPVPVTCRLRYRVAKGELAIGYQILRPDDIVRASFLADVVGLLRAALPDHLPVVEGKPAAAGTPR